VENSSAERITAGWNVAIDGIHFSDNTGLVGTAVPDGVLSTPPAGGKIQCARLRIAPVQRFAPYANGSYVLHDPKGYEVGGSYRLDSGARLAAQITCSSSGKGTFPRYSLALSIDYTDDNGFPVIGRQLAWDLENGDEPVGLPSDIRLSKPAMLHASSRVQSCSISAVSQKITCSNFTVLVVEHYQLDVGETGRFCSPSYADYMFAVD